MRYIATRLFQGIFILIGVAVITFFLPSLYFSPISIAIGVFSQGGSHHFQRSDLIRYIHAQGLDQPLVVQFWHWLVAAVQGNFGISFYHSTAHHNVSVNEVLSGALWRSVYLVAIPTALSILVAIPIGLTQAVRRNKIYDHVMTTSVYVLYSTPALLICTLMAYYFAIVLHFGTPNIDTAALQVSPAQFPSYMFEHFNQFVLPFLAIMCLSIGGFTRYMRGSALDTLVQDYVRTARAKGASPTRVLFRHVFRPSVIPLLTIIGLTIPALIGGALIVEYVFDFPGMGILTVKAVEQDDFRVVMAVTVFTAFLTVIGNLAADVFTAVADPRVRLGGTSSR